MKFTLISFVIYAIFFIHFVESSGYGAPSKQKDTVLIEVPKQTIYKEPVYEETKIWNEPEYKPVIKDYSPKEILVSKETSSGYGAPKIKEKVWNEPEYEPEIKDYSPKEILVSKETSSGYGVPKIKEKVWNEPVYEEPKPVVIKVVKQPVVKVVKIVEKVPVYKEPVWNQKDKWIRKKQRKYGYWKRDTSAVSLNYDDELQPKILVKRNYYGYNPKKEWKDDKKWKEKQKWKKEKKWNNKKYAGYGWINKRASGYAKVPKIIQERPDDDDDDIEYDKKEIIKEIRKLEHEQQNFQDEYERKRNGPEEWNEESLKKDYNPKEILVTKETNSGYGVPKIVKKVEEKVLVKERIPEKPMKIYEEEPEYEPEIKYKPKEVLVTKETNSGYGVPKIVKKVEEKVLVKERIPEKPMKIYEEEPKYEPEIKEYKPKEVLVTKETNSGYGAPKIVKKVEEKVLVKERIPEKPMKIYEEEPKYEPEIKEYKPKEVLVTKKVGEKEYIEPNVVDEVKDVYPEPEEYVSTKKENPSLIIEEKPEYDQKEVITTKKTIITTPICNKLMDGLLENLQSEFVDYMSKYPIHRVEPISLGRWGQIQLHDGHMNHFGRICRGNDFQATPWGKEQYLIEGVIQVPEPKCEFKADARMYNRLKFRNQCVRLAAKDATFKVAMLINKPRGRVHVAELEPLELNEFHLEDEKGSRKNLKWPFTRINKWQLEPQKHQFMVMLTRELCNKFREMIHRPEVTQAIISQV